MKKYIYVILIVISVSFLCSINVFAATKITPTLSSNDGCEAYYIQEGKAYNLYADKKNTAWYVLDGNKPSVWNDTTKYQQIIIATANGNADGMFIYDFKEEILVKSAKVFTVTEERSGVGWATQAILCYSDDNVNFYTVGEWQSLENGTATIETSNEEKHRYWGVRAKSTTGQEYMSVTEFELYDTNLTTNENASSQGTIDDFIKAYKEQINENLQNNKCYMSVTKIISELSKLFTEDYSRGKQGLAELGILNLNLRKPTKKVAIDHGNDVVGSFEQEYEVKTSEIDYGINNMQILNLDWFFGTQYENGYYEKGAKYYTDIVIGGFAWLAFIYFLWKNLPSLIAGEVGQLTNITKAIEEKQIKTEVKEVSWKKENKGEGE